MAWCGWIPTRPCMCMDDSDRCERFPWHTSDPVDDDWSDRGGDDDERAKTR